MKTGPEILVRLSQIVGIDPQNVRRERSETDQACLRASLRPRDLLQALILRGDPGAYTVLAGGSRWQALCSIAIEDGDDFAFVPVRACVFEGTDAEALAVSLAENKDRADLHPADEYESYSRLVLAGFSIERIAKDHGTSRNHVRRRLALAALSPKVLEAFRRGVIGEETAKAFCATRSHAEQEWLLVGEPSVLTNPEEIRKRLRGGAVRGSDPKALYVGIDAYVAAGGEAPQNLFEPEIWFSNGELLRRLARDKMMREGKAICAAEGWAGLSRRRTSTRAPASRSEPT
jgi:ParB family chromosome partitioning protein